MAVPACMIVCLLAIIPSVLSNDCSSDNMANNLQLCLDGIWNRAKDKSAFFYGTNWQNICGYNPIGPPYCTGLKQPYTPHSLLDTIYGLNTDYTANPLKQYLHVTFTSAPGTYKACGNTYTKSQKVFSLEPLVGTTHEPWTLRSQPEITWTSDPTKLYSLFVYDSGADISHAVILNIQGNDIENAEIVRSYNGPTNPSTKEQPYVFMLFEQTDRIALSNETRAKLSQYMVRPVFNYSDIFAELQLQGPIAMNWMLAPADPYSIQVMVTRRLVNECPALVSTALNSMQLSFIPNNVALTMTVDVDIHNSALTFQSCCKQYAYSERTSRLNPLGNGYISPGYARADGTVSMSLMERGLMYIPIGKKDVLYTLVCVDISVPNPSVGTRDLPILHMLSININGSSIESGDTVRSYRGPAPPDNNNHVYLFLLYSQKSSMLVNETEAFYLTKGCSSSLDGRCLFNVSRFIDGADLTLVGASWFLATHDEYVRYMYLGRGQDADSVCANIPGYDNPCPVGSGTQLTYAMTVFVLQLFSIFVSKQW